MISSKFFVHEAFLKINFSQLSRKFHLAKDAQSLDRNFGMMIHPISHSLSFFAVNVFAHDTSGWCRGSMSNYIEFCFYFQGGSVIQCHHKDWDAYIAAEGIYGDKLRKDGKRLLYNNADISLFQRYKETIYYLLCHTVN